MRIYIASSWKNEKECLLLAEVLRQTGHDVDCFCDTSTGRYVFHFSEIGDPAALDAISFLSDERSQRAFAEDRRWLDWSEAVVLLLPCGKSAHLEAGYAKGSGKKLFILGDFPCGEFDVMYGFADALVRDFGELLDALDASGRERRGRRGKMRVMTFWAEGYAHAVRLDHYVLVQAPKGGDECEALRLLSRAMAALGEEEITKLPPAPPRYQSGEGGEG